MTSCLVGADCVPIRVQHQARATGHQHVLCDTITVELFDDPASTRFARTWRVQATATVYIPYSVGVFQVLAIPSPGCDGIVDTTAPDALSRVGMAELQSLRRTLHQLSIVSVEPVTIRWAPAFPTAPADSSAVSV